MAVILRIFIGSILLVSGLEKVISPYQNFMYVIQGYEFLPSWMEKIVALSMPWAELIVGIFLVLGLWIQFSLKAAMLLFAGFIVVVGQALIRSLPIDQCGCFGESIHIPPKVIIVFDSFMLLVTMWLLRNPSKVNRCSLDKSKYFLK